MLKVVHCKKEKFDIYIGRGGKWGNPFSHLEDTIAEFKVSSREEAISKYREWIKTQPDLLKAIPELRNKRLGCWCNPLPCHGDILVELVKEYDQNNNRPKWKSASDRSRQRSGMVGTISNRGKKGWHTRMAH